MKENDEGETTVEDFAGKPQFYPQNCAPIAGIAAYLQNRLPLTIYLKTVPNVGGYGFGCMRPHPK